jgi:hypothetical protein
MWPIGAWLSFLSLTYRDEHSINNAMTEEKESARSCLCGARGRESSLVQIFSPDGTGLGVFDLSTYGRPYAIDMRAGRLIAIVWPKVRSLSPSDSLCLPLCSPHTFRLETTHSPPPLFPCTATLL